MAEDALWKYLRDRMLPPGIQATRIESRCSPGFPDVHYNYAGASGTLELKFLRKKKLPFDKEGLNREQIAWHRSALEHRALSFIVAEVHRKIFVIPGIWYSRFNEETDLAYMSRLIVEKGNLSQKELAFFSQLLAGIRV